MSTRIALLSEAVAMISALDSESVPDVGAPSNRRYVEGQSLYLRSCEPRRRASLVVNNDDLLAPFIVS